jgi:DUF971 family protein
MIDSKRPKHVTVNREKSTLEVVWMDDHPSVYPLSGLRYVCPCVECRGGHAKMGGPPDRAGLMQKPEKTWEVQDAELVGNYALRLIWSDGHDSGIFTWTMLRTLCPCEECEAAAS